jgi:hypothetical protein
MKSSLIARMKKKCYKNYNAALRSLAKASDSSLVVLFQVGISRNAFVGLRPKSANGQPGGVVCKFGLASATMWLAWTAAWRTVLNKPKPQTKLKFGLCGEAVKQMCPTARH